MNKNNPDTYDEAVKHLKEAQRCLEIIWADNYAEKIANIRKEMEQEWNNRI